MPKRVIDYEAMWGSGKLNDCKPENRAEYAWLYGLADANGSFELSNLRVIFGKVAAIRPELTMERLREILRDFHKNGLLYVWKDEKWGRIFGHWVDSDKPGRLPPRSQRRKYGISAPPVPKAKNQKALPESVSLDLGLDSHHLSIGVDSRPSSNPTSRREGVGFGVGLERKGVGVGLEGEEAAKTEINTNGFFVAPSARNQKPEETPEQREENLYRLFRKCSGHDVAALQRNLDRMREAAKEVPEAGAIAVRAAERALADAEKPLRGF